MSGAPVSFPPLDGRVAVVLGATGGIGRAVCRALADAGATVVMVGRDAARLDALARELHSGADVSWVPADVTSQLEVDDARASTIARHGRVDLLVVSTGVVTGSAFEDGVPADWARMIDVNLRGLLLVAQAFADPLLETATQGRPADMILIGGVGEHLLAPRFAVFNAVSAAIKQLSRTLRQEYGPRGLRVHTLEPGVVDTEFGKQGARAERPASTARVEGPVEPEAIAALVAAVAALPAHVNVVEMTVTPTGRG